MEQNYFFHDAKWVGAKYRTNKTFSIMRGYFNLEEITNVTLNVLGLGFFKCYINGICINPDTFLPLSSEYDVGSDPVDEVLSGHRIYVPKFDITPYVKTGKNVIAIHFGGGWYTFEERTFGLPKAIYSICAETNNGKKYFTSNEECRVGNSFIDSYYFTNHEKHNYSNFENCFDLDFDDSSWEKAVITEEPNTEYSKTNCPADALIEELTLKKVKEEDDFTVYDCGVNTTGYPVFEIDAKFGETITVSFSEEILPDGNIDRTHHHKQQFIVVSDGKKRLVEPLFTWYGFRYIEVKGNATPKSVKVVHANIPVTSTFHSDNKTLNWIYNTFVHTMLCNMHTGHPSDCPHIERRGYTGDGQLTCHAVLSIMDGKDFYEKWLQDIADSQDSLSGHIQYTAPYIRSGGGPGGWGCAIVEVPYQLYKHYGDKEILSKYYDNMCRYIDYLKAHSEFNLVTSDKAGEWCLGDWCGPIVLYPDKDITLCDQQIFLPAAFVNTYFMIKSLNRLSKIAAILGKNGDSRSFLELAEECRRAVKAAYYNSFDSNFFMNIEGANAFGIDLKLGNDATYSNMVNYYRKIGHYDTGIFGTDILTRTLFEHGDGELAVDLLTGKGEQGFAHWMENGATTFHEYWDSNRSRSHNHPMFGAVVAYFFEFLLGIGQEENTAAYSSLIIKPLALTKFKQLEGSMKTPNGTVFVSYKINNGLLDAKIKVPKNTKAVFKYKDREYTLTEGENTLCKL